MHCTVGFIPSSLVAHICTIQVEECIHYRTWSEWLLIPHGQGLILFRKSLVNVLYNTVQCSQISISKQPLHDDTQLVNSTNQSYQAEILVRRQLASHRMTRPLLSVQKGWLAYL